MKKLYRIILILVFFGVCQDMEAQIWLTSDSTLYFGRKDYNSVTDNGIRGWWNVNGYNGMYWTHPVGKFLRLDLTPANPRIAGTANYIYFRYGTVYYDTIYVDRCIGTVSSMQPSGSGGNIRQAIAGLNPVRCGNGEYSVETASLENILPEAVVQLDGGGNGIDYDRILSLLMQGIDTLNEQIQEREKKLEIILQQDQQRISYTPGSAMISYELPQDCRNAYLQICDENGFEIRKINITGTRAFQLDPDDMAEKEGYFTLVADDRYICTRKITFKN